MTPFEAKTARLQLGLSVRELADALYMGQNGWRRVIAWETPISNASHKAISGPAQRAIELLLERQSIVDIPPQPAERTTP